MQEMERALLAIHCHRAQAYDFPDFNLEYDARGAVGINLSVDILPSDGSITGGVPPYAITS
jgi:hypothetical protein